MGPRPNQERVTWTHTHRCCCSMISYSALAFPRLRNTHARLNCQLSSVPCNPQPPPYTHHHQCSRPQYKGPNPLIKCLLLYGNRPLGSLMRTPPFIFKSAHPTPSRRFKIQNCQPEVRSGTLPCKLEMCECFIATPAIPCLTALYSIEP